MLYIKLDRGWSTGFRDIHVYKDFWRSGARNSKVTYPIRPEFEHVRHFMPVQVISKFDKDSVKMSELASRNHFPNYMSM